jgi:hypothetical protein
MADWCATAAAAQTSSRVTDSEGKLEDSMHPSDIPIEIGTETAPQAARPRLNNVSPGGLSCECAAPVEPGAQVKIRIPVVRPAFETKGKVVWCHRRQGHF